MLFYTRISFWQRYEGTSDLVYSNEVPMGHAVGAAFENATTDEKTVIDSYGSNKTTGLYNSHDDHDTASVSQHIKDARSPFYTPERRTRADSAGSEQKYSHKPRLSTSVTLNTEDELSDNTNESQH